MAHYVNIKNVVRYCVIKNDEICLLNFTESDQSSIKTHKLKIPSSEDTSKSSSASLLKKHVIYAAVSYCGKFVSACDTNNLLHLWKYDENSWNHLSQRKLVRKCQKVIFTNSSSEVLIADRSGDVLAFSVSDYAKEGTFLLGHISLIVDIALSENDKFLLTCDRDGKIRVSHYPNSYHIYSYCLGHEEFVSSIQSIHLSQEIILSSSGDGTVRLWNFSGDCLCCVNLFDNKTLCEFFDSENDVSKSSVSCLLDEKQTNFAVKCIRYSPLNKVCAVLFYLKKGVALFSFSDCKTIFNCRFIQCIQTDSIPFDAFFSSAGDFIILQKEVEKSYLFFRYDDEKQIFCEKDSKTVLTLEHFENMFQNIGELTETQDSCDMLFKKNFDDKDDVDLKSSKKSKIA